MNIAGHRNRVIPTAIAVLMGTIGLSRETLAEYRVEPGDVVEVVVSGLHNYRHRVTVQLDGTISLPLARSVVVAGSNPADLRLKIVAALASRVVRHAGPDGREQSYTMEPSEISANVVEYRPVYVSGDVLRAGEQPYRPGMTVRQAISTAGGIGAGRQLGLASDAAQREALELQSSLASLWVRLAKEQAIVWRLRSELGSKPQAAEQLFADVVLPKDVLAEIVSIEQRQLKIRNEDHQHSTSHLQRAVAQADEHIAVLTAQLDNEAKIVTADSEDLKQLTGLYHRGNAALPRISEARRVVLLSSARQLQTRSQLIQVKKERADSLRELKRLDDLRQIRLLQEVQEATARLAGLRSTIKGHMDRIRYANGEAPMQGRERKVIVYRKKANGELQFRAGQTFPLEPGDVVELQTIEASVAGIVQGGDDEPFERTTRE